MAGEKADIAVTSKVLSQLRTAEENKSIIIPPNYSAENALKSAWLILQSVQTREKKPVLEVCDPNSITQALFNMAIQGLNPAKNQCYFIAYGDQLTLSRSYLGTIAITKRLPEVKDVKAYAIYDGDEFEYEYDIESGSMKVTKYVPKFQNINVKKLQGAFAIVIGAEGILHTEVMTMDQVRAAWNQGQQKGDSPAHRNFPEEMAKKSVINRACKTYYSTSDDSSLMMIDEEPTDLVTATYQVIEAEDREEKKVIDVRAIQEEKADPPKKATKTAASGADVRPNPAEQLQEFDESDLPF